MLDITFYWTLERNGCLHLSINFLKRACEVEGQPITGVDGECGSWIRSSFVQRVAWFYSWTSRRYPVDAQWARYDGSSSQLYFCLLICQVVLDGPVGTPYDGGKFRLKMLIPMQYPMEPPKAYFCTKIFHPNIAPNTGEVCVNTLKKDWKSNLGLRHILLVS